jgi:dTDP-4-dehydrorhamnose reductase
VYTDQLQCSGHAQRLDDLDRIAALGIRTVRYPILWERTAPNGIDRADWRWADERLDRLRQLGIRPIVGLVHHGSGPRHTSLLDPTFAEGLADFAAAVAERYPWVDAYTPVNEPLTTARFAALYGHWHPHARDDRSFATALLNECRAVILAMDAIRIVQPAAQLVQTEDMGKTYSTRRLAYQAAFENERRWLSLDLLCGSMDASHPLWEWLRPLARSQAELEWFRQHPCPPDVIGINHYLSSERFLDHRLDRYPDEVPGGNGTDRYVDLLAARVAQAGAAGPKTILREVWERYHLPLAVTEAHNGCTREEQLRWIDEVWSAACALCRDGVDLRAVTMWSLFGAYDWDSMVTRDAGHYEPGVFDVRSPKPRPTALAAMARALATDRSFDHPVLATKGWWRRPERLQYPAAYRYGGSQGVRRAAEHAQRAAPILIVGAHGTLGQAMARACIARGLTYHLATRQEIDIADADSVARSLEIFGPWAVVNAAGYVRVDEAEIDTQACFRENAVGPAMLAAACRDRGIALLTYSSDLVFDGAKRAPYVESDPVAPLNVYGRSKAVAEQVVLAALPAALVVRTSAFFSPSDHHNFVTKALASLEAGRPFAATDDVVSPTYVPDLVDQSLDLLIDGERGIWHLANAGAITWAELARRAARLAGLDPTRVWSAAPGVPGIDAQRPAYSALASERGWLLPSLDDALLRYMEDRVAARSVRLAGGDELAIAA